MNCLFHVKRRVCDFRLASLDGFHVKRVKIVRQSTNTPRL